MGSDNPAAPVSVPVAIVLGLIASFVQSLGLTIQRKSHVQNAALPSHQQRRSEWKRPLWLFGFAIFIVANIGGTIFQIGALPIVMLAPLGAVSLLYNALLARFILDDFLSHYMVIGTALIGVGAVLIGYFGAIQEPPHTLDELLALYSRPPFVAFATIFVLVFLGVLVLAHLAEWQLHVRLFRPYFPDSSSSHRKHFRSASASSSSSGDGMKGKTRGKRASPKARPTRRWSAPTLAPVVEVSESSSGIATPVLAIADEASRRGLPVERVLLNRSSPTNSKKNNKDYGTLTTKAPHHPRRASTTSASPTRTMISASAIELQNDKSTSAAALLAAKYDPVVRRTCLSLSVAYGAASGTLSGACLLLAKSGVELLVLTIAGHNQFSRWQSWALVGIMLMAALLQLWYLNKALRLADPTLVCPLAFCFYNTSSIALGLVYFNQLGALRPLSLLLVVLGTGILLAGVWIVSMHGEEETEPVEGIETMQSTTEREALLTSNAAGITGPHLPPVPSPTAAEGQPQQQQPSAHGRSDASSSPTAFSSTPPMASPPASPSSGRLTSPPAGGYRGRRRRSRSGSGSGSFVGGLGLYVPGLSSAPALYEAISSPTSMEPPPPKRVSGLSPSILHPDLERGDGQAANVTDSSSSPRPPSPSSSGMLRSQSDTIALGNTGHSSPPVSSALRRTRDMYRAVLERGLSIGISPSSPGFHLAASFASEEEEEEEEEDEEDREEDRAYGEEERGEGGGRRDVESIERGAHQRRHRESVSLLGAWKKFVKRRQESGRIQHLGRRTASEADVQRHDPRSIEEGTERPTVLLDGEVVEELDDDSVAQAQTEPLLLAREEAAEDAEPDGEVAASSSSGWNVALGVDYSALSERLSKLKTDAGGWFGLGSGSAGRDAEAASSSSKATSLRSGEEEQQQHHSHPTGATTR